MQLRPQAHDIIRTWAFSTIVKQHLHTGGIPWETIMISGHALAADGSSIHKSLGNAPVAPETLLDRYGADAVRYWACSGNLSADQPLNEDEMRQGGRLAAKLWSAARFLMGITPEEPDAALPALSPADRALRSWTQRAISRATAQYLQYEYAAAREVAERFFWDTLCDNALEWSKGRLYDGEPPLRAAALLTLRESLRATLLLLAPIMPHVTEAIYQAMFADPHAPFRSIHTTPWPVAHADWVDPAAEQLGEALIAIGAAVRRYKTSQRLGMGTRLAHIQIGCDDASLAFLLERSALDLRSLTRAEQLTFSADRTMAELIAPGLWIVIER
jgi:valyl-tRNA synthetase